METSALFVTAIAMLAPDDHARMLEAAKAGDRTAFEHLMRRHERMVLGTAWRLLGNPEDAQDVAQEVFWKLYRNLRKIDASENLASWLYRVTVNLCRDHKRQPRMEELGDAAAPVRDPDQELNTEERRRILELSLRMLPEKERAAFVLRDLEGLSTREVAGILGSSETTVRSQISRARLKVKDFVERHLRRRR
ncbi:MAG TPA: sigma-70 family RNA polymerase sigma factor [Bryobacteraceae bacterium]